MSSYQVSIEIGGRQIRVGDILFTNADDAVFSYAEEYLERPDARPISLSLPLQAEHFSPKQTKTFFSGLLPEGFTRRSVASWMHVDEDDYFSAWVRNAWGRSAFPTEKSLQTILMTGSAWSK